MSMTFYHCILYLDMDIKIFQHVKILVRNSLGTWNYGMYVIAYAFNMCTKRITILMQVNQNLWKVRYDISKIITWHHDSLTKLHFMKSTSVKYIIFFHFDKLHQISYAPIIENLWLPSITFFKWGLIIWRSHQCMCGILDDSSHP